MTIARTWRALGALASIALTLGALATARAQDAPAGQEPALNPDMPRMTGSLVVVCRLSNAVCIIDLPTQEVRSVISTAQGPHEVAVSPDGRTAIVSIYGAAKAGQELAVVDVEKGEIVNTIDLGRPRRPHGFAWLNGSRLLVSSEMTQSVVEVCAQEGKVVRELGTEAQGSHMVVAHAGSKRAFTTNIKDGNVSAIDLATGELIGKVSAGVNPEGVAITPDGAEVWAADRKENKVYVINAKTLETSATIDVGRVPFRIAVTPDGATVLVSCPEENQIFVIDRATRKVTARVDNFAGIRMLNEGAGEGPTHPVPCGLAVTPDGAAAFISNVNSQTVGVLDLAKRRVVGTLACAAGPDGMAWTPVVCKKAM